MMGFILWLIFIKIVSQVARKIVSINNNNNNNNNNDNNNINKDNNNNKNTHTSIIVIEVIRPISSFLFFFYEEILHTKKT